MDVRARRMADAASVNSAVGAFFPTGMSSRVISNANDDTMSQYSGSNAGPPVAGYQSSSKVSLLANEIASLEERSNWLEGRNRWLSQRMMVMNRNFLEKTLMGSAKSLKRRCIKVWTEALYELRVERHLLEQTESLDQCQKVAKDLGAALSEEQEKRRQAEAGCKMTRDELNDTLQRNEGYSNAIAQQNDRLSFLEHRLREAEAHLVRSHAEAMNVIEHATRYETRRKQLDDNHKQGKRAVRVEPDQVADAQRTRENAKLTTKQLQHLLPGTRGSRQRDSSPERELPGTGRGDDELDLSASRSRPMRLGGGGLSPQPSYQTLQQDRSWRRDDSGQDSRPLSPLPLPRSLQTGPQAGGGSMPEVTSSPNHYSMPTSQDRLGSWQHGEVSQSTGILDRPTNASVAPPLMSGEAGTAPAYEMMQPAPSVASGGYSPQAASPVAFRPTAQPMGQRATLPSGLVSSPTQVGLPRTPLIQSRGGPSMMMAPTQMPAGYPVNYAAQPAPHTVPVAAQPGEAGEQPWWRTSLR